MLHSELVLPVIRRFEWIMRKRNQIEDLNIEGNVVVVRPVSPMSRAADLEEANRAMQFLQGVGAVLPNEITRINGQVTMTAIKDKMGAGLVEILSDDEWQEKIAMMNPQQGAPQ